MNHFDYADYAKSQALRSKVGRFAGQFQHYAFEFYERNQKNLINAHLHYSLDKFKELPLADLKYEKNRENR